MYLMFVGESLCWEVGCGRLFEVLSSLKCRGEGVRAVPRSTNYYVHHLRHACTADDAI